MPESPFQVSLRALTEKDPIPYQKICQLYQEQATRVAKRQGELAYMTIQVLKHLSICQVLQALIPIESVDDEYLEYLFVGHALGDAKVEELAAVLRLFAISRYALFDALITKVAIMQSIYLDYPDILERVIVPKESE